MMMGHVPSKADLAAVVCDKAEARNQAVLYTIRTALGSGVDARKGR